MQAFHLNKLQKFQIVSEICRSIKDDLANVTLGYRPGAGEGIGLQRTGCSGNNPSNFYNANCEDPFFKVSLESDPMTNSFTGKKVMSFDFDSMVMFERDHIVNTFKPGPIDKIRLKSAMRKKL